MIGILVVCHGKLAEGFYHATSLIVGTPDNFSVIGLFEDDSIDALPKKIREEMNKLNNGEGVLIFVDMLGASPFNAAIKVVSQLDDANIELISGANLPMLLEAIMQRESDIDLKTLANLVLAAGKDQMHTLTELMSKQEK